MRSAVGHHDHGRPSPVIPEDRFDLVPILERDVRAARAAINMGELLAGPADHRRIHERHHLFEMLEYKGIERRVTTCPSAAF
jgi:hypothetical protein